MTQRITAEEKRLLNDEGFSDEQLRAEGMEWDEAGQQDQLRPLPSAAPVESSAFTGRTPEEAKGEPLKIAGVPAAKAASTVAGMYVGGGVGNLAAKALLAKIGTNLGGRIFTGMASGVAGGGASRGVTTPGGFAERAKAMVDPKWVAADALFGGALGTVAGSVRGTEKEVAQGMSRTVPRNIRTGLPNDIGKRIGTEVQDPRMLLEQMKGQIGQADATRFGPIWAAYPNPVTHPAVLDQWQAIRRNLPAAIDDMLAEKDILREPLTDLVQQIGNTEVPTLQGIQRLKESLDDAIRQASGVVDVSKDAKTGAARGLRSLVGARQRLTGLTFEGVEGGDDLSAALAASSRDRASMSALKEGNRVPIPTGDPLAPKAMTAGKVKAVRDQAITAGKPESVMEPIEAFRSGVVGRLGASSNPLQKLRDPGVSEKVADALSLNSPGELDRIMAPWEEAQRVIEELRKSSNIGVAGNVGGAGAVGGVGMRSAQLLAGALGIKAAQRKLALRAAEKLSPLFKASSDPDDAANFASLLAQLHKARLDRSRQIGNVMGYGAGAVHGARDK